MNNEKENSIDYQLVLNKLKLNINLKKVKREDLQIKEIIDFNINSDYKDYNNNYEINSVSKYQINNY